MVTNNLRLILGIGNSEPNSKMEFLYNKAKLVVNEGFDRKNGVFGACKDFLCPPENQFREWFRRHYHQYSPKNEIDKKIPILDRLLVMTWTKTNISLLGFNHYVMIFNGSRLFERVSM